MKRKTPLLNLLVARRMMSGYSQEAIAEELGVTQSSYSKFESGKAKLPIQTIDKLMQLLELEVVASDTISREEIAFIIHKLFKDNESVSRIRSIVQFLDGIIKEYRVELDKKGPHKFIAKQDE
jgi:transcriptional regulator with XRE-family HTH domain